MFGHPAESQGSAYSGSTAWDAAVRSRWLLQRPEAEDGAVDDPARDFERELRREKSNYSSTDDVVALRWVEGAFVRVGEAEISFDRPATGTPHRPADDDLDAALVATIEARRAAGVALSASPNARNYAPRVLAGDQAVLRAREKRLAASMHRLLQRGTLISDAPVCRTANRKWRHGLGRPDWSATAGGEHGY